MSENEKTEQTLTHVVGTFLIQAEGAFLNGAGLGQGEDRNMTVPKTLSDFKAKVPYVSSQAWKRWLRNTFQDENPSEPATVLKALKLNAKGNPEKIGTEMDPILFPEDDIFGYMRAQQGQGRVAKEDAEGLPTSDDEETNESEDPPAEAPSSKVSSGARVKSVMRPSPFAASILMSLRKTGWEGIDEGYVHLQEGTPLPYKTRFYNTQLQGVFGLNYGRLGVFRNEGDRVELDPVFVDKYLREGKLEKHESRDIYTVRDNPRRERAKMILRSLAVLRKPAKEAQFATDIAPKIFIVAGLTSGNLIFNDLFEDTEEGPKIKIKMLQEVIADYANRLTTPVFIGIRTGYLNADNEAQLRNAFEKPRPIEPSPVNAGLQESQPPKPPVVEITTPLQAIERLVEALPQ